jgi:hypothetical protein
MRRFVDIVLSRNRTEDCTKLLAREYNKLMVLIETGRDKEVYRVRASRNGMTRDYVRLNSRVDHKRRSKYAELKEYYSAVDEASVSDMDLDFYVS